MATDVLETVQVEDGNGGFYLINACDFDPKEHTKYGDKPKTVRKPRKVTKSED